MDYLKNAEKQIIGGREISFVRCDRFGNVLSKEQLAQIEFSNEVIDRVVSEVSGRISAETVSDLYSQGITTG
ncbi:MAG: hypothetical protein EOM14_02910 [Clostridia bacterium]|nr:hypothetical protein [Clostridia bacterium]